MGEKDVVVFRPLARARVVVPPSRDSARGNPAGFVALATILVELRGREHTVYVLVDGEEAPTEFAAAYVRPLPPPRPKSAAELYDRVSREQAESFRIWGGLLTEVREALVLAMRDVRYYPRGMTTDVSALATLATVERALFDTAETLDPPIPEAP